MAYVDPFGGSPVRPAEISYQAISLTTNLDLAWPSFTATANVVSRIMDVTPSGAGLEISMPPANQAATGQDTLIRNLGASTFTVTDNSGNTIMTVAAGAAKYLYLSDNSTVNGSWESVAFGVGSSSADAATLAGYGLLAIGATLNAAYDTTLSVSSFTISPADRAKFYVDTSGATISLPAASGTASDFFFLIRNASSGTTTLDCAGSDMIDGAGTLALAPDESVIVCCDGTSAWYSVGRGRSTIFAYTQLVKNVAGGSNVTLTSAEAGYKILKFTGALLANINIIVPNVTTVWYVDNQTTGPYSLTIKTVAGTGVSVTANNRVILYCDGVDVLDAQTVFTTSGLFTGGSASAPSISFLADTDTGFYNAGPNQVGVAANGTNVATFTGSGLDLATPLAITEGGTGATTAPNARTNLDVYSKSEVDNKDTTVLGNALENSLAFAIALG